MKSERRHELQTNTLADWLGAVIDRIRPYQTTMLGVVLLLLLLILGGTYLHRRSAGQTADAWDKVNMAARSGNLALCDDVIQHDPGTTVAAMAGVVAGDYYLAEATQQQFANRATANANLAKAIDRYSHVLETTKSSMLKERATFGLASALESQGHLEEAAAKYKEVAEDWPKGECAAAATRRLQDIRKPEIRKFYDDFRNFDPKPALANEPGLPTKSGLSKPDSLAEPPEPVEGSMFKPRISPGGEESKDKESKDKESKETPQPARPSSEKAAPAPPASKAK
jgi:tetratricopeptide (TPR) repeat protein